MINIYEIMQVQYWTKSLLANYSRYIHILVVDLDALLLEVLEDSSIVGSSSVVKGSVAVVGQSVNVCAHLLDKELDLVKFAGAVGGLGKKMDQTKPCHT